MHSNEITGKLPEVSSIAQKSLRWIDTSNNRLTGEIPRSWYGIKELNFLYLNKNKLSGSITNSISELSTLKDLWLSDNMFRGDIPLEIGVMSSLGKSNSAIFFPTMT